MLLPPENQTVAVTFLDGITQIWNLPVVTDIMGNAPIKLNLDDMFADRSTSIRFKGFTKKHSRIRYIEMNLPRKSKQNRVMEDRTGQHVPRECFMAQGS